MEKITLPDAHFPWDQLVLTSPILMSGGNYFIKYVLEGNQLYMQLPKCKTRQGIVKSGKQMFCDFLFTNENEAFIQWLEELELLSQKTLFENRSKWFETELTEHEIESSFTNSLKIFKSGKFYILRVNIPTRLGKCSLRLFNENEDTVDVAEMNDQTNIIAIVEILGIKCSSRNFQIEMECKQIMAIKPEQIFEKCVISLGQKADRTTEFDDVAAEEVTGAFPSLAIVPASHYHTPPSKLAVEEHFVAEIAKPEEKDEDKDKDKDELEDDSYLGEDITKSSTSSELIEIDFSFDNLDSTEQVQLKNRNDVYYDIYKQAKQKAKEAKNIAVRMYLESKQIKDLYKLDDVQDSDEGKP